MTANEDAAQVIAARLHVGCRYPYDEQGCACRVTALLILADLRSRASGPDSERIREAVDVLAPVIHRAHGHTDGGTCAKCDKQATQATAALRAAGLLPGPDDIAVSREDLSIWMAASGVTWQFYEGDERKRISLAGDALRAALSQPHPAQEQ